MSALKEIAAFNTFSPDLEQRNQRLAAELGDIAVELQRGFLVEIFANVSKYKISMTQFILLGFVNESSGMRMSELSKLMFHAQSTTTGIVDRLTRDGLVARSPFPEDQRRVVVRITDAGREMLEAVKREIVREIRLVSKDLDRSDLEAWVRVYRIMRQRTLGSF